MARRNELNGLPSDLPPVRRELAKELRKVYERIDLSMREIEHRLHFSRSTVSRSLAGSTIASEEFIKALCELAGCTPAERRALLDLREVALVGSGEPPRESNGDLKITTAAAAARIAIAAVAAAGAWVHQGSGPGQHPDRVCQRQPIYIVTRYGNVLNDAGNTIGVVDKGDVFIRDVSGVHNRRYRYYGTVLGSNVTGFVMMEKLNHTGTRCIT
jgi:transcriptional regulator with XRE-family HTH domain